jgi:hypothetical protein
MVVKVEREARAVAEIALEPHAAVVELKVQIVAKAVPLLSQIAG